MQRRFVCLLVTFVALPGSQLACDSDSDSSTPVPQGCSILLEPGADDTDTFQTALIEASSDDTLCIAAGSYSFTRGLSLSNHSGITIRGMGATRNDTVLDFAAQTSGSDALTVTAPNFVIENLTLKNSLGNGIVVHGDVSVFRNVFVTWDAGPKTENGAYAFYPRDCTKTIIEDCEVSHASDAGIYVGICEDAIVRRNDVHGNVAGIEIENTHRADVYDNEVYDNTFGLVALQLPGLKLKSNRWVLIRENNVHDNNRDNFAAEGALVAVVPAGIGLATLAGTDIQFVDNRVENHDSTGIFITSYPIIGALTGNFGSPDPDTDPYVKRVLVSGNTFVNNGKNARDVLNGMSPNDLPDVLWDGFLDPEGNSAEICLTATPPSFLSLGGPVGIVDSTMHSTDTSDHLCTHDPLPQMTSFVVP